MPIWQEPVEARLLVITQAWDARSLLKEAELARRLDIGLLHKLHGDMKTCTIAMLCRWCNGRHLDPAYVLLFLVLESLRQEAAPRDSRIQAKKCRLEWRGAGAGLSAVSAMNALPSSQLCLPSRRPCLRDFFRGIIVCPG